MNTNFLNSLTNFIKKRTFELMGLLLILSSVALAISFITYSPEDPSFIYGDTNIEIKNLLGIYGSSVADFMLQSFGLTSFLLLANFIFWGINLLKNKEIKKIILKLFLVVLYLIFGSVYIYMTFNNSFWLIDNGNSGFIGEVSYNIINNFAPWINNEIFILALFFFTLLFFIISSELNVKNLVLAIPKFLINFFKNKKLDLEKNYSEKNNLEIDLNSETDKPQQSFIFDKVERSIDPTIEKKIGYKLP